MTRDVSADFGGYKQHLDQFRYEHLLADKDYVAALVPLHQSFLALLTLCSELTEAEGDAVSGFELRFGIGGKAYLRELVSDIGQSLFCFSSGAYKASLVTLRSSIESFAKSLSLSHTPDVLTQKNVYLVFDLAKTAPFFKSAVAIDELSRLLQIYDELNLYVHTVTDQSMFHYLRLGVFPQYVPDRAAKVSDYLLRVMNAVLYSIASFMRDDMFKIHHKNRDVILAGLQPAQRVKFYALSGTGLA